MPSFAKALRSDETTYCGWVNLGNAMSAGAVGRAGFDAVVLDQQHGFFSFDSVRASIHSLAAVGVPAIVRVPFDAFPEIGRVLDVGAEGIICPMINTAEDAQLLVDRVKYPPIGKRSFAPHGAAQLWGMTPPDYLKAANENIIALAMIETRQALDNLDAIMATDGLDGVFVGPYDMSISLSNGELVDPDYPPVWEALEVIAASAKKHGKMSCVFSSDPKYARRCTDMGFKMVAGGSDLGYAAAGAKALLEGYRGA